MSAQDFGIKNAVAIRTPATANLMIDSDDRNKAANPNPFNFTISENQSIMNGFFHRIGTTEAVLEWCDNNISGTAHDNSGVNFFISTATATGNYVINIPDGHYTVSSCVNRIVTQLNQISTTTGTGFFILQDLQGELALVSNQPSQWYMSTTKLANQLDCLTEVSNAYINQIVGGCPDLRPYRYLDFVSDNLGYNQKLKDNSTNGKPRNVLLRWYFADDGPEPVDGYGYPIFQGYLPFNRRRLYNPPKQIRWDNAQAIGQLQMRVYDEQGNNITSTNPFDTNYLLTLQLSEN